ncbi:MAG: ABC transporter ATP-binding protein [Gammaproteobacteria bacterium]|nr:ABC transporter ATP-binding protein [Gammaproteobacteria bacterium]
MNAESPLPESPSRPESPSPESPSRPPSSRPESPSPQPSPPLLQVRDLVVEFATRHGRARVLDRVSLGVARGEILGLVGESGCGKSMTALAILGLVPGPAGRIAGGSIQLEARELTGLGDEPLRRIRGKDIGMIFQEPMSSLNPVFTVGEQIAESVRLHENAGRKAAWARAVDMLKAVDIPEPAARARAYPHQLSGGMRQRVMIAIALACRPRVLIADEPTTALDTTVQAQIFDLLRDLQRDTGAAIILITHDMGAVAELADRVAVMYAGRVVEQGGVAQVLSAPRHPYTRGLSACVPHLDTGPGGDGDGDGGDGTGDGDGDAGAGRRELVEIPGVVPSLFAMPRGCAFAPRCADAVEKCARERPAMRAIPAAVGHAAACWVTAG